jgi:hypothetical protein
MSRRDITLRDFFGWGDIHGATDSLSGVDATKAYEEIKKTLSKEAGSLKSVATKELIANEVDKLLGSMSLTSLLVRTWNKSKQLQKYSDSEKYPPDEPVFLPLLEHSISSTQRPVIEVLLNDRVIGKINFEVAVKLTLEGVVLKIQGGRIKEIRSASGKGKGKITAEGAELFEKETESLPFPGVIDLGEGEVISAFKEGKVNDR